VPDVEQKGGKREGSEFIKGEFRIRVGRSGEAFKK